MKQNNLTYDKDWKNLLDKIIELITDYKNYDQKKMLTVLNKIKIIFT